MCDDFNHRLTEVAAGLRTGRLKRNGGAAGFVLRARDELIRLQAIEAAVNRTEDVDISPCMECGKDCICIPDGLPVCSQACADKVGG